MKSTVAASAKRRWKWFVAAVLALVFFSLLVPLAFLLGLHNRFPSGNLNDDRASASSESSFGNHGKVPATREKNLNVPQGADLVDDIMKNLKSDIRKVDKNTKANKNSQTVSTPSNSQAQSSIPPPNGISIPPPFTPDTLGTTTVRKYKVGETTTPCELEHGSYCLWSIEHKEKLKDDIVKRLKDQLFMARSYFPTIAKMKSEEKFSREIKQNIQDYEKMLSDAIVDADLPLTVEKNIQRMELAITKAKSFHVECVNVIKKLAQILDLTEDEAQFHTRQGAFLYHLGVQTMPKSLHCLSLRLTGEYFRSSSSDTQISSSDKHDNPSYQHYVIFSKNILASSVTVNSTVVNAEASANLVFHVLTNEQNYYALKLWFSQHSYKDAVIHVLNVEKHELTSKYDYNMSTMTFSEEFRISVRDNDQLSTVERRIEYISIFGHSHFLLPDIFKNLKKVVVLDDDVVVQKDLSPLWDVDMKGKVVGAVQFCEVRLGQLKRYLGKQNITSDSCIWTSGLNIIDLEKWREVDISTTYQMLRKEIQSMKVLPWRAASLPISLLAFQDHTFGLSSTWLLSGLGKDYELSKDTLSNAAVLHYNGNMKPWLELGIPRYKSYWRRFLTREDQYMDDCNVSL